MQSVYISYGEMSVFVQQHMASKLLPRTGIEWGGVHTILFFCENLTLQAYVSSQEMYMHKMLIDLQ